MGQTDIPSQLAAGHDALIKPVYVRNQTACETSAIARNARERTAHFAAGGTLAATGQRWLGLERAMGIEPMGKALPELENMRFRANADAKCD
jgi:hypothetical protein